MGLGKFVSGNGESRKWWLPALSPFPNILMDESLVWSTYQITFSFSVSAPKEKRYRWKKKAL